MKTILISTLGLLAVFGTLFAVPLDTLQDARLEPYRPRLFEGVINDTINKVVAQLAEQDPLQIEHLEEEVEGHSVLIENAIVEGFSNVYASKISLTGLLTLNLDLILEAPRVVGNIEHWKVDGEVVYGDGTVKFEVIDSKIQVKAKVSTIGISVKDVKIKPTIGHADVTITGLQNDEELSKEVSERINEILNDYVNNNTEFHAKLSQIVQDLVNKVLGFFY